jgi:SAM-dependent methyltransferase
MAANIVNQVLIKLYTKVRVTYTRFHNHQKYKGNKVICSICNSTFKEFIPAGLHLRPNARCPNCGSMERHRLIWKYISDKTTLLSADHTQKLLHFAPEKCLYEKFIECKHIDYTPCDLSPEKYNFRKTVNVKKIDITSIGLHDNSVDVVLCNHVLEHIPNDAMAMNEVYRVMKQGGWGIFQVPIDYSRELTYEDFSITDPKDREAAFGQHDHVRWYGRDYTKKLMQAGFTVFEDEYVKKFSNEELFRYGLHGGEIIYLCKKT